MTIDQDLSIRGDNIQRIYEYYYDNKFLVNRRYQRKLVWTIEEKCKFIDSIIKGFPIPIILLANVMHCSKNSFEIIDGMQRLHAINSFIENDYSIDEKYFDLNTMVLTKNLLDKGALSQKEPILDRDICSKIASYSIPLSFYTINEHKKIDEIFKRVNAYGRHLSPQELRVAGSIGEFPALVRKISSDIRTDSSPTDVLYLSKMKEISITNAKIPEYGIQVDDVFWVKNHVITREMLRESKDEEIVADILVNMLSMDRQAINSDNRNAFYGFIENELTESINAKILSIGSNNLKEQFFFVFNQIRSLIEQSSKIFQELIGHTNTQSIPRYFAIIFLAIHKIVYTDKKTIFDIPGMINTLSGVSKNIHILTGGNWSAKNIRENIDSAAGIIARFYKDSGKQDPIGYSWSTEFEALMMQSRVEGTLFDFKQGILNLDAKCTESKDIFPKIIKTLVAMCNSNPNSTAYIFIGVADKKSDAKKIETLYGITSKESHGYFIVGFKHEADKLNLSLDQYVLKFVQGIKEGCKENSVDSTVVNFIASNIKAIRYYDKDILVLKLESGSRPRSFNKKILIRSGSSVDEISGDEIVALANRFDQSKNDM